ncbi:MAG: TIR domain-containing protein [Planctomycetes bacterium]|nr:TIR domain-containing protein [Planctomycetota bacterium]
MIGADHGGASAAPKRDSTGDADATDFWAFISYSHVDTRLADRLQRRLERTRIPPDRAAANSGPALDRSVLYPVFRDRTDARSGDLDSVVDSALRRSHCLVLVSTQNADGSKYVRREVERFIELHRGQREVLVLSDRRGSGAGGPPSWVVEALGRVPLCADIEQDGLELAALKVTAGIVGCDVTRLLDRQRSRRIRILTAGVVVMSLVAIVVACLAFDAMRARDAAVEREYRAHVRSLRAAIQGQDPRGADKFLQAAVATGQGGWELRALASTLDSELRSIQASDGRILALASDPQGTQLVSLGEDGTLVAWDPSSGARVAVTGGADTRCRWLCAGAGGTFVYLSDSGAVGVWRPTDGEKFELPLPVGLAAPLTVAGLVPFSESHEVIGVLTMSGELFFVGTLNHHVSEVVCRLAGELGSPIQAATAQTTTDQLELLFGGTDGRAALFRIATDGSGQRAWTDTRSSSMIMSVALEAGGRSAAFGDSRGELFIVDKLTGESMFATRAHNGTVYDIEFDGSGRIWTCGRDGTIAAWTSRLEPVARYFGHRGIAESLVLVERDARRLAYSVASDGRLMEWDRDATLHSGADLRWALGFRVGWVVGWRHLTSDFICDGRGVGMAMQTLPEGGSALVRLDLARRKLLGRETTEWTRRPLLLVGDSVVELVADPHGPEAADVDSFIGIRHADGTVERWLEHIPITTGAPLADVAQVGGKCAVALADGRVAVRLASDRSVDRLDLSAVLGEPVYAPNVELAISHGLLSCVPSRAPSNPPQLPGSRLFVVNVASGTVAASFDCGAAISASCWAEDGGSLWIATDDRRVQRLDLTGAPAGLPLRSLPLKIVTAIAVHPGEPRLALGADDGTVSIWRTTDGEHIVDLGVLESGLVRLGFTEDGEILTAASASGDFRFWSAATGK